ncbi:MAG: transposase, partial [Bacteroidales bacterium]|nr:transposase [Bacteroidales bacterium]
MIFEKDHLYHIYNQGNNRQPIFFERDNYLFFLEKVKNHILPYADILAWCFMPNHFHLMVCVNEEELPVRQDDNQDTTNIATLHSHALTPPSKTRSFQQSIGLMLASYTRAINNRNNRSGSLFRQKTKSICLSCGKNNARAWFDSQGITVINIQHSELQYPNICFNYINFNPVKD